jgi:hypothetical protein
MTGGVSTKNVGCFKTSYIEKFDPQNFLTLFFSFGIMHNINTRNSLLSTKISLCYTSFSLLAVP